MTIVINLLAGSGAGKTTARMLTSGAMKSVDEQSFRNVNAPRKFRVQEVSEFVKAWADLKMRCTSCGDQTPRVPSGYDQAYIFGCQSQQESTLYHNYDYLVTDSPMLLSGYYEQHHLGKEVLLPGILNFIKMAEQNGITYLNFMLKRNKEFDPQGRFETAEQAAEVDVLLQQWMTRLNIPFISCDVPDIERPQFIIDFLEIYEEDQKNHDGFPMSFKEITEIVRKK